MDLDFRCLQSIVKFNSWCKTAQNKGKLITPIMSRLCCTGITCVIVLKLQMCSHVLAGESNLLLWDIPSRPHETDQPGGGGGRGSRGLFPGVPGHAGGIAVPQGRQTSCCQNTEQSLDEFT